MGIRGPKVEIHIQGQVFKANDVIKGRVVVESSSAFDVQNLDVLLRCTETAKIYYYDRHGLNTVRRKLSSTNRLYSYRQTLFPTHEAQAGEETPISYGRRSLKPANQWNSRYTKRYTIQGGTHNFEFELKVPEGYPPPLPVDRSNKIFWTVGAKLFSGGSLSRAREATLVVKVHPGGTIEYVPNALSMASKVYRIKAYGDGYRDATSSVSGFFKNLISSEFKTKEEFKMQFFIPQVGLMQSPHKSHFRLSFSGPSIENFMIKDFEICLNQKIKVTLRKESRLTGTNRDHHERYFYDDRIYYYDARLPCSEALERINREIDELKPYYTYEQSFISEFFEVSYKLDIILWIYPREKSPSSGRRLYLSIPLLVQPQKASVVQVDPVSKQKEISAIQQPAVHTGAGAVKALPAYSADKSGLPNKSDLPDKSGPAGRAVLQDQSARLEEPVFQENPISQAGFALGKCAPPESTPVDAKGGA